MFSIGVVLCAADILFTGASLFLAFQIKFRLHRFWDFERTWHAVDFQPYLQLMVFAIIVRLMCFFAFGIYRNDSLGRQPSDTAFQVFKAVTLGTALIIIVSYLGVVQYQTFLEMREFSYSRQVLAYDYAMNLALVGGAHVIAVASRRALRRRGIGLRSVAVQGTGDTARALLAEFANHPELGYRAAGFLDDQGPPKTIEVGKRRFQALGSSSDLLSIINEHEIHELVITDPASLKREMVELVDEAHKVEVVVKLVPDLYGILLRRHAIEELAGMPVVQVNEVAIVGLARILKRAEDVLVSSLLLLVFAPLMAFAAVAIKIDSPGPVFFRQRRIGKSGRHFGMHKFRSMYVDAEDRRKDLEALNESDGPLFKMRNDPRVTQVGRIIRRLSIDELPQFFNVLKGEMSLVGPRPLPISDVHAPDQWEQRRFSAVPGITGLWQVNRIAHTAEEMLKWDLYYIENWSLWLDLQTLLKTVGVVISGRGAY
ncbi:MAG: sugar transferase [Candidatus Hydrogenedentota bacterium]